LTAIQAFETENDVRTTLMQGLAGLFFLITAFLGWQQIQVVRDGEITDRFSQAISQIGDKSVDVRVGGLYALGRIADDSAGDREMIMEVLSAHVRQHSSWLAKPGKGEPPTLRRRAPDVQTAMTILSRRATPKKLLRHFDLTQSDLRRSDLLEAHLEAFDFHGSHLEGADLWHAHLEGTDFREAHFEGRPRFGDPYTYGATRLEGAFLDGALLQGANLSNADLMNAHLAGADLSGADLSGARLTGADLAGATATTATRWPSGFDPRAAGVKVLQS
jgi:hypothetical protein